MDTLLSRAINRNQKSELAALMAAQPKPVIVLDDADGLDPTADSYTEQDLRLKAAASVAQWLDTEPGDLDDGENMADRLVMMLCGIANDSLSGEELDADEQEVAADAMNYAWDYMAAKGVTDDDIDAVLNGSDVDAAARVVEFLKGVVPDSDADVDTFAFDSAAVKEAVALDAAYRKKMVVRHGKRLRVNKRVSGKVHLSSKQKMSIRKAQRRAHSAKAMMSRRRSVRVRARMK